MLLVPIHKQCPTVPVFSAFKGMSNYGGKSPRSKRSNQHSGNRWRSLIVQGIEKLAAAQQQALEREKQRVATAKFPWLAMNCLFSLYFLTGFLLACLPMPWALVGWIAVLVISMILIAEASGEIMTGQGCNLTDLLAGLIIVVLADPLRRTIEAFSDAMKRHVFNTTSNDSVLGWKLDLLPMFCFFVILLVEGLGLWLGYLTKTYLF